MNQLIQTLSLLFITLIATSGLALAALKTQPFITINNGQTKESGVLADAAGTFFIEIPKGLYVRQNDIHLPNYEGELLPPQTFLQNTDFPRDRMREVVSFDFLTSTGTNVTLTDKFYGKNPTQLARLERSDDQALKRQVMRVLIPLKSSETFGSLKMWYQDETDQQWQRLGGILNPTSAPLINIYEVRITKTGSYTLFDEDPSPELAINTPVENILLAPESPFPSVPNPEDNIVNVPETPEANELVIKNENQTDESLIIPAIVPLEIYQPETNIKSQSPQKPQINIKTVDPITNQTSSLEDDSIAYESAPLPERLPTAGINSFAWLYLIGCFGVIYLCILRIYKDLAD